MSTPIGMLTEASRYNQKQPEALYTPQELSSEFSSKPEKYRCPFCKPRAVLQIKQYEIAKDAFILQALLEKHNKRAMELRAYIQLPSSTTQQPADADMVMHNPMHAQIAI